MSDYDSDDEVPFTLEPRGYLYEPEFTEEELLQMETRQAERDREETSVENVAQERIGNTQWCECMNCISMPTDPESYCCHEWNLVTGQIQDLSESEDTGDSRTVCITYTDFPALLTPGVLRTFFGFPKINWKKRPKPEGPNDSLSPK